MFINLLIKNFVSEPVKSHLFEVRLIGDFVYNNESALELILG